MSRSLKLAVIPLLAFGMTFLSIDTAATADGPGLSAGNYSYRSLSGSSRSLRAAYASQKIYGRSFRPTYNYRSKLSYHAVRGGYYHLRQPQFNYTPPKLIPRGTHFEFIPGHWDRPRYGNFYY